MLRKGLMAATVLLLLLLVLVTPRLIGVREDISTLPRLILNFQGEDVIAFITSLSGTYVYKALYLNVTPADGGPAHRLHVANSHALEAKMNLTEMRRFALEAAALDRRDVFFDTAVDVRASLGDEGWSFRLLVEEETTPRILTQEELTASPFATLMERREAP